MSLSIRDVGLRFGGVRALANVTFEVHSGGVTSLIGPNGAGKTTLFNVITGFLRPNEGDVVYDGQSLIGLRPYQVAERGIVRTFQKTSVFPQVTVFENVMIALHMQGSAGVLDILRAAPKVRAEERQLRERAAELLELVGLSHRCDNLANSMPYGEQRILEMAIALGARPRMLLLDEPAAGLNTSERMGLIDLIGRIRAQGVMIFLVEHDMRLVMGISDRVIVLDHGQIIALGTPGDVQTNPDVIRAYLGGE
jgi:branched-chain amino acid transport system ATP-binding protein